MGRKSILTRNWMGKQNATHPYTSNDASSSSVQSPKKLDVHNTSETVISRPLRKNLHWDVKQVGLGSNYYTTHPYISIDASSSTVQNTSESILSIPPIKTPLWNIQNHGLLESTFNASLPYISSDASSSNVNAPKFLEVHNTSESVLSIPPIKTPLWNIKNNCLESSSSTNELAIDVVYEVGLLVARLADKDYIITKLVEENKCIKNRIIEVQQEGRIVIDKMLSNQFNGKKEYVLSAWNRYPEGYYHKLRSLISATYFDSLSCISKDNPFAHSLESKAYRRFIDEMKSCMIMEV